MSLGFSLLRALGLKIPKYLFIPEEHWPSVYDLQKQRLCQSVLDSENFERMVRCKSAQPMQKFEQCNILPNFPLGIEKSVINDIADLVHRQWIEKGNSA